VRPNQMYCCLRFGVDRHRSSSRGAFLSAPGQAGGTGRNAACMLGCVVFYRGFNRCWQVVLLLLTVAILFEHNHHPPHSQRVGTCHRVALTRKMATTAAGTGRLTKGPGRETGTPPRAPTNGRPRTKWNAGKRKSLMVAAIKDSEPDTMRNDDRVQWVRSTPPPPRPHAHSC
jgi:hypothetical protein